MRLHSNRGLSVVVRKELMAEAAASEKGLSVEEKVREMLPFPAELPSGLLSLSWVDLPGYL